MDLTPNALEVLRRRYLRRDADGRVAETPEQLFGRVAGAIARTPDDARRYERAMREGDFLPNSPALMNAGREFGQLFACFVLPVTDALTTAADDGIFDAVRAAAIIHQTGGGTGFAFSRLRPEGARVSTTSGRASGPVSFMRVFNAATEAIQQGGFRRGANMGILRVDHPDILDFIDAKVEPGAMRNFNLSVGVTDAFLRELESDATHRVVDPRDGPPRPLRTKVRDDHGTLIGSDAPEWTARQLFARIVQRAWEGGDPGLVFLDRINAANPTPAQGPIEATNPCGEMPLLPFEACNLGSINLSRFAGERGVDRNRLREIVRLGVRFLDDAIDATRLPLPQIERVVRANRKIGLGVMGWADLLLRLGLRYDSDEALALARSVMSFIREEAWRASMDLAAERGPFPAFAESVYAAERDHPLFADVFRKERRPLRNATVTSVAPTGTLSILAGTTGGIEPAFSLAFTRHVLEGATLPDVNSVFEEIARREGFWSAPLVERLAAGEPAAAMKEIPSAWREVLVTAHEIAPEAHLRVQAAFQEFTDNAVSKTVNFPASATPADVQRVYEMAIRLGVKGITVYRDRSRSSQPMALEAAVCIDC